MSLWSPILIHLQSKEAFCLLQWTPKDRVKERAHPWGSTWVFLMDLGGTLSGNNNLWAGAQQETRARHTKTSKVSGLVKDFSVQAEQRDEEKTTARCPLKS